MALASHAEQLTAAVIMLICSSTGGRSEERVTRWGHRQSSLSSSPSLWGRTSKTIRDEAINTKRLNHVFKLIKISSLAVGAATPVDPSASCCTAYLLNKSIHLQLASFRLSQEGYSKASQIPSDLIPSPSSSLTLHRFASDPSYQERRAPHYSRLVPYSYTWLSHHITC